MSRRTQWCAGPPPSPSRPPATACVESAWRARAIGCWACSGTTAVPSSIRELCAAISDTMVRQSKSLGTCGIHAVSSPADSAHSMSETNLATLRAISPRSAPIITPTRTIPLFLSRGLVAAGQGADVPHQIIERSPGRKYRCCPGVQQLGYVRLGYRAADHDGDVGGVGRTQRLDGAGGQRDMGAGQNAQPDDGD